MSRGNLDKAWIRMRHVIAISELMRLPKISKAVQIQTLREPLNDQVSFEAAQLWDTICSADRLLGAMLNLPTNTRRYRSIAVEDIFVGGNVQTKEYLAKLGDMASRVQALDDANMTREPGSSDYASVLELDRELRAVASYTPKSWWDAGVQQLKSDQIVQIWHYYLMMRIHLPFTMQQSLATEYTYSRSTCIDACHSVANRYQALRQVLPSSIFLSQIVDLQALTAIVVLIITSYSQFSTNTLNSPAQDAMVDNLVQAVTELMDAKSQDKIDSHSPRDTASAIRSLHSFLKHNHQGSTTRLKLKVPLLGKICIQRSGCPSQAAQTHNSQTTQIPIESDPWIIDENLNGQPYLNLDKCSDLFTWTQPEWQWNFLI